MNIEIRPACPEDAADILELSKIFGSESDNLSYGSDGLPYTVEQEEAFLVSCQHDERQVFYVALADGKLVGTCNFSALSSPRMAHRGSIGICVRKSHWGKGVAPKMMEALLHFARDTAKVDIVSLEVRSDNLRAIKLYEKFGFEKTGVYPGFMKINGEFVDFDLMHLQFNK